MVTGSEEKMEKERREICSGENIHIFWKKIEREKVAERWPGTWSTFSGCFPCVSQECSGKTFAELVGIKIRLG